MKNEIKKEVLPTLEWVSINKLHIDETYQRSTESRASARKIAEMAKAFSWRYCGALMVTRTAENKYYILDGQHRWEAAKLNGNIKELPCLVLDNLGVKEQAIGFVHINTKRLNVSALAKYAAALTAHDPLALKVSKICAANNITIPRQPVKDGKTAPTETQAIGTLLRLVEQYTTDQIGLVLRSIPAAYGNQQGKMRAMLIKALALLVAQNPEVTQCHVVAMLKEINPLELEVDAASSVKINGGSVIPAMVSGLERVLKRATAKNNLPDLVPRKPLPSAQALFNQVNIRAQR